MVVDLVVLLLLAVGSESLHHFFGNPVFRLHRLRFLFCVVGVYSALMCAAGPSSVNWLQCGCHFEKVWSAGAV